jgi:hypothetical protein
MNQSDTNAGAPLRTLVLLRLAPQTRTRLSRRDLVSSILACAGATADPVARQAVEDTLTRAIEGGDVSARPLSLTDQGRRALDAAVGPGWAERSWRQLKGETLPRLATGRASERRGGARADVLGASAMALALDHDPSTAQLTALIDKLAWRALGVDTDAKFELQRVRRHLLRDLVPSEARVDQPTWRRMVAMRVAGLKRCDAQHFAEHVVARWAFPQPVAAAAASEAPSETAPSTSDAEPPSPSALAAAVKEAALAPDVTRFHDDRAFIASVWAHMQGKPPVGDMPLESFKEALFQCHRAGLLRITRAELVGVMDPADVAASELERYGATFHFVAIDGGVQ